MNPIVTQQHSSCRQTGLSLVELMISLTLGLILLLGITTLIVQQNSTRSEMEKSSRQIENGRYAMQLLRDDIQHAGYYGEYSPASGVATAIPTNLCDTTTANLGWNSAAPTVPVAIFGYPGASTTADPTSCGALSNYKANTAILVIQRTETNTATADGSSNYLQVSLCSTATVPFVLATSGFTLTKKNCATLSDLRKYIVRIYYLSSCNVCGTGGDTLPTLKMVENGGTPTSLVDGIENMQFDYGIDSNLDGSPDSYTATPAASDWPNVMAVQVSLLARNTEATTGYTDAKTYKLGAASTVTPGGAYKRHLYSALVRVINPSGRRESP